MAQATPEQRSAILALLKIGCQSNDIAEQIGVSPQVVWGIKAQWTISKRAESGEVQDTVASEVAARNANKAIGILRALAEGIDPFTHEMLPEANLFQHPDVIRALFQAVQALERQDDRPVSTRHELVGPQPTTTREEISLSAEENLIYERLKSWRNALAGKEGAAPFVIASNDQLKRMVKLPVRQTEDLLSIKGFGERRAQQYGEQIIEILQHQPDAD